MLHQGKHNIIINDIKYMNTTNAVCIIKLFNCFFYHVDKVYIHTPYNSCQSSSPDIKQDKNEPTTKTLTRIKHTFFNF